MLAGWWRDTTAASVLWGRELWQTVASEALDLVCTPAPSSLVSLGVGHGLGVAVCRAAATGGRMLVMIGPRSFNVLTSSSLALPCTLLLLRFRTTMSESDKKKKL